MAAAAATEGAGGGQLEGIVEIEGEGDGHETLGGHFEDILLCEALAKLYHDEGGCVKRNSVRKEDFFLRW